jgi:glyoxylase-like metal-dependent hydrolase (beta-lactamase superfamily II)
MSECDCHRGIFTIPGPLPALQYPPTIDYEPVRGRIWTAAEGTYRTIFLEGDTGVICFDTFYSPGAARSYRGAVARRFPDKPVHTVVYSHDHLDHTGYAADLAPEAEVIAHRDCADVVAARRSDGQKPATEVWDGERRTYEIDGTAFELIDPGPTHGNGNVAAWFPDDRVLFMVDTVIPGVGYTFFPDWHLASYVATMRRLESLDWDLFVPGHYWPVDRDGYRENLEFYELMADAAQRALVEGVDPDDYPDVRAYAHDRYGASHGALFRYGEYFAMNLMRAMVHFRTGGWGLEDNHGAAAPALEAGTLR